MFGLFHDHARRTRGHDGHRSDSQKRIDDSFVCRNIIRRSLEESMEEHADTDY